MMSIEYILLAVAMLLLLSVLGSKASGRVGVPALLLFLALGMLAGSDGLGGIAFDDPWLAQSLGVVALAFILFTGGLDTRWEQVRPVLWPALALSTLDVGLTAALYGDGFLAVYVAGLVMGHRTFIYPLDFEPRSGMKGELVEITMPERAAVAGKHIVDIGLPDGALIVLVRRDGNFVIPGGSTVLEPGDRMLVLTDTDQLAEVRRLLGAVSPLAAESDYPLTE